MALISCPECSRQISDQTPSCPGCGYPIAGAGPEAGRKGLLRTLITVLGGVAGIYVVVSGLVGAIVLIGFLLLMGKLAGA